MKLLWIFLLLASTPGLSQEQHKQTYVIGEKITSLSFPDMDGKNIDLSGLRDKKLVIVELWATWCGPCVEQMKRIPDLRKKYPDLEFYSISIDQSPALMKKFVQKRKYNWPIVYAGNDEFTWDYFQIKMIPRYFFVDGSGIIQKATDHLNEEEFLDYL